MKRPSSWIYLLFSVLAFAALLAACGGGDDDDDDDDDSGGGPFGGSSNNGSSKDNSNKGGNLELKVPAIKDGNFQSGKVHIELSGGKDLKADMDGNGLTTNGFTLLTFTSQEIGGVIIAFQKDNDDEPGSVSVTTKDVVTGGTWGKECTVTVEDSAKELKGTFECKNADALIPKSTRTEKLNIKGNFTVTR